jgi:cell division protein FtsX
VILLVIALAAGLSLWSHWLIKRTGAPRSRYGLIAGLAGTVAGLSVVTAVLLSRTLDQAEDISPADKQAFLSQHISSAMMWTLAAFGIAAAWMIGLVVLTVRGRV